MMMMVSVIGPSFRVCVGCWFLCAILPLDARYQACMLGISEHAQDGMASTTGAETKKKGNNGRVGLIDGAFGVSFIRFTHVRVPRRNLLCRYIGVDSDGNLQQRGMPFMVRQFI